MPTSIFQPPHFSDIFFKDSFSEFSNLKNSSKVPNYPFDVAETSEGMFIAIACIGKTKEDIKISTQDDTIEILIGEYEVPEDVNYLIKKIVNKKIDLNYKVGNNLDITKLDVTLSNGLLRIDIPFKEESKKKDISIN